MVNSLWKKIIKTEIKVFTKFHRWKRVIIPRIIILIISNINFNLTFNAKKVLENNWILNLCNLVLIGDDKNANMKLPLALLANRVNLL